MSRYVFLPSTPEAPIESSNRTRWTRFLLVVACCLFTSPASLVAQTPSPLNPGDLIVGHGAFHSRSVHAINPLTGSGVVISNVEQLANAPFDIAISPGGDLYMTDGRTRIFRVDASTGAQTVVASGGLLKAVWGIALAPGGQLIVTDSTAGEAAVIQVDPASGAQTLVSTGGLLPGGELIGPWGIAVAPNGKIFVCGRLGPSFQGRIVEIDPTAGAQSLVAAGGILNTPQNLAFDAAGNLIVADSVAGVIRVAPQTGAQTLVSAGGLLDTIGGVAIAPAGDIYVTSIYGHNVVRVDPVDGVQTEVFTFGAEQPRGIDIVPSASRDLVRDGLIAHWRMDEEGSTYVHDSVGTSHGTRVGGIGNQPGISGKATSFEGASYGITAANGLGDFGAGDFTVSAWVKRTSQSTANTAYIFSHYASYSGGLAGITLQLSGDGQPGFFARDSAGRYYSTFGPLLTTREWHHLSAVRSGDNLSLYVDGVLASSAPAPGLGNCTDQISRPISYIRIGAAYSGPNHWYQFSAPEGVFDGHIDEVMVYGRALSPGEIQQNHAAVSQGLPAWNHVIAQWSFEETTGTDVSEVTGRSPGFHTGATLGESGPRGKAFRFDGVDDAVIANNGVGSFGEGDFTITVWMKAEHKESGGAGIIFHHYGGGNGRISNIDIDYNYDLRKPAVYYRDVYGNLVTFTASNTISFGEWHHIGVVRQGASVLMYVDGVLEGSGSAVALGDLTDQFVSPIQFMRIGGAYTGPGHQTLAIAQEHMLHGSLDDLKIFSRAFSAADIRDDMGVVVNAPPVAEAGTDQSIRAGATVNLDGSASFDDNTDSLALAYSWSFVNKPEGSSATLSDPTGAGPSFTADIAGTYVLQLVVTDEQGAQSEPDTVTISSDNQAPTAVATVDFGLAIVGASSRFDGTGSSDPENDSLTYAWSITEAPAGSTATLADAGTATPTLVTDVAGTYRITLAVSDFIGEGTPATVVVVATTPANYAEIQIIYSSDLVEILGPGQVTNGGNQNAFSNFLQDATILIQAGDIAGAISKLNQAIQRTDGCALRGSPDGNGGGRDWITDCQAQNEVYALLTAAKAALQN